MSDNEYTPTLDEIRDVALLGAIYAAGGEENLDMDEFRAMFDRAISRERAKADLLGFNRGYGQANREWQLSGDGMGIE